MDELKVVSTDNVCNFDLETYIKKDEISTKLKEALNNKKKNL